MNKKTKQFIEQFEIVFDTDWEYSKDDFGEEMIESLPEAKVLINITNDGRNPV